MKAIALPRIDGATLFQEADLVWGMTLQRRAVVLLFSKPIGKLYLVKKHAAFLAKGLRWLAGGAPLYSGGSSAADEEDPGGNDPGLIELGCTVTRENGTVVIDFGGEVKKWAWSPAAAEYAAGRIDVEAKALPKGG